MLKLDWHKVCPKDKNINPTSIDCQKCNCHRGVEWVVHTSSINHYPVWRLLEASCDFDEKTHWSDTLEYLEKLPSLGRHQECPKDKNIKPSSHDCQECDFCKGLKRQENQIVNGLSWQPKFVEYFVFCGFKNENNYPHVLKDEIKAFQSKIIDAEKSIEKLQDRCEYFLKIIQEMKIFMPNKKKDG